MLTCCRLEFESVKILDNITESNREYVDKRLNELSKQKQLPEHIIVVLIKIKKRESLTYEIPAMGKEMIEVISESLSFA